MLETIMSEKYYLQTFGALEWDPDGLEVPEDGLTVQNSSNSAEIPEQVHELEESTGNDGGRDDLMEQENSSEPEAATAEQIGSSLADDEEILACQGGEEVSDQPRSQEEKSEDKPAGVPEATTSDPNMLNEGQDQEVGETR